MHIWKVVWFVFIKEGDNSSFKGMGDSLKDLRKGHCPIYFSSMRFHSSSVIHCKIVLGPDEEMRC